MTDDEADGRRLKRRARPKARIVKVGDRRILASGLDAPVFGDLYYQAMRVSWLGFFAGFAGIFLLANILFALIYSVGANPIANARPGSLTDLFFFSVETVATVGYGDMHPQTFYAHLVATIEIFTGMSGLAVVTGLVFSRFSRPRARLIFARNLVVGPHDGHTCLMVRVANQRHNMISEATAKLWILIEEEVDEGARFRRFHELTLERSENPVFALTWMLFHVIDETSLLHDLGPSDLEGSDAAFIVTISGIDDAANQRVNSRKVFSYRDVRWGHRYVDVLGATASGLPKIDYTKFHDSAPVASSS
jgi:inward rectifier potassium channel